MKRNFITIIVASILFGCASKELSEEQKKKNAAEIEQYYENVVKPAMFTALATCAYKLETEDWPKFNVRANDSKVLSNYKVISEAPFSVEFQIKPSIVLWNVKYTQIEDECLYTLSINSSNHKAFTKLRGKIKKEELDNINEGTIVKYLHPMLLAFNFMEFRAIDSNLVENKLRKNHEFNELLGKLGEVTLKAALCLLLGASGGRC